MAVTRCACAHFTPYPFPRHPSLSPQGIKKEDIGREAFLEKVWGWKRDKGGYITQQMRRLGVFLPLGLFFFCKHVSMYMPACVPIKQKRQIDVCGCESVNVSVCHPTMGSLRSLSNKHTGASADWSREKFTLDPDMCEAVVEAFVRLYEAGLIYRGAWVDWCWVLERAAHVATTYATHGRPCDPASSPFFATTNTQQATTS